MIDAAMHRRKRKTALPSCAERRRKTRVNALPLPWSMRCETLQSTGAIAAPVALRRLWSRGQHQGVWLTAFPLLRARASRSALPDRKSSPLRTVGSGPVPSPFHKAALNAAASK